MSEETDRAEGKPPHLDRLSALWRRLNEHKLVQWSVAYVALAYAIQHAIILTGESFEWPNAVARVSMLLLVLGLPLVVTFAWYHGARASRNFSQAELSILAALLVMSSLLFYVFVRPAEQAAAPAAQQAGVTAARNAAASLKGAISLAVLPFVNLSSDKEQEFFSDGMTEEITSALAKVPDLHVVARTSASIFKDQKQTAPDIGRQLNATHLIEGSVRKAGDRVRITVQLINVADGTHVWSEDYDRQLTDIFAVQEDIARTITTSLRMPLGLKPGENLVNNRSIDPATYDQYLRGKALVRQRDHKPLSDGTALLEQVVARSPDFAPAWAQLALGYVLDAGYHPVWNTNVNDDIRRVIAELHAKGEDAARHAVALDANLADAYLPLGRVRETTGQPLAAEEFYVKALALDPSNPETLHRYSLLLVELGRIKEAVAIRQRLQALEPFAPVYASQTAQLMWLDGQTDAAIVMLKALPATGTLRTSILAEVYASAGRFGEAADTVLQLPPGVVPQQALEAAVRLLRTAPAKAVSPQTLPRMDNFNYVYLHVGAPMRALESHEQGAELGFIFPSFLAHVLWHPSYAPVRNTGRFKALVRKAGLIEYWRAKGWPPQCHATTGDDFACN